MLKDKREVVYVQIESVVILGSRLIICLCLKKQASIFGDGLLVYIKAYLLRVSAQIRGIRGSN